VPRTYADEYDDTWQAVLHHLYDAVSSGCGSISGTG
jgi:hypothetical protein